ncbi:MAG: SpoIVB peptidase S55 domain-containing protein [bacterium]
MTGCKFNMPNLIKTLTTIIFLFAMLARPSAAIDYLPVSDIKPGMKGYGRSVFSGTSIETFDVKVVGVIPKSGPSGEDLILVRVGGEAIESRGGISLGMSGSPVYVNDRLIGAISMNFPEEDSRLGGVTPVESMVRVFDYGRTTGRHPLPKPLHIGDKVYTGIAYCLPECSNDGDSDGNILHARYAMLPVMINGLSARTYRFFESYFQRSGLSLEQRSARGFSAGGGHGAATAGKTAALKPGSAISVQLVSGDIDIAAVGTLTAIDGRHFIAFGHPLFRKGQVKYILADAFIYDVVKDKVPFKLASSGAPRGTILEDRGSAVSGVIDQFPKLIPLTVTVKDASLNRELKYSVRIVEDRDLIIALVLSVILQAVDNSIDRIGEGTSTLSFNIAVKGYENNIERENTYYSRYDIASESLYEIFDALNLITNNFVRETFLSGLKIQVDINSSTSAASIESAEIMTPDEVILTRAIKQPAPAVKYTRSDEELLTDGAGEQHEEHERVPFPLFGEEKDDKDDEKEESPLDEFEVPPEEFQKVRPGEEIGVKVTIRPYRQESVEETMFIMIPEDIEPGTAIIDISSGTKYRRPTPIQPVPIPTEKEETPHQPEEDAGIEELEPDKEDGYKQFEELVKDFVSRDKNNELVATVLPMGMNDEESDKDDKDKEPLKTKKSTQWVLNGSAVIKVTVETEKSRKERKIKKSRIRGFHFPERSEDENGE